MVAPLAACSSSDGSGSSEPISASQVEEVTAAPDPVDAQVPGWERGAPGESLAFGDSRAYDIPLPDGGHWTVGLTVHEIVQPAPSEYELHGVDSDAASLFYVKYSAEVLDVEGTGGGLFTITPNQLFPQFEPGRSVQYAVTSIGECAAPADIPTQVGQRIDHGCLQFEAQGTEGVSDVVFVPDGRIPHGVWSPSSPNSEGSS